MCLTENLPNRGKHVAPDEKAAYPSWASTVPNFIPNRSLGRLLYFYDCLLSFACYKSKSKQALMTDLG